MQAFTARNVPLRLVASTSSHSSGDMSSIFACGKMPALAQSTSIPPFRSAAVFAIASRSASLVTSAAKAEASPPSSVAHVCAGWRCRPTTSSLAPFLAKTPAMPLPMPLLPPVTTTDLPATDVSMRLLPQTFLPDSRRAARPCAECQGQQRIAAKQDNHRADRRDGSEHRDPRRIARDHLGIEEFRHRRVRAGGVEREREIPPGQEKREQAPGERFRETAPAMSPRETPASASRRDRRQPPRARDRSCRPGSRLPASPPGPPRRGAQRLPSSRRAAARAR